MSFTIFAVTIMCSKNLTQRIIQIGSLVGLGLGVYTMLRMPTVILPPWFLVLMFLPILFGVSCLLGIAAQDLTKSRWNKLTFTLIFMGLFSMALYISEYRPTYKITVPESYSGEVILLLAIGEDQFKLNDYGIGYVSESTYREGFEPKVVKGDENITNQIRSLSYGTMTHADINGKTIGPYKYLSLTVPGTRPDSFTYNLVDLIRLNAVDTTRLLK